MEETKIENIVNACFDAFNRYECSAAEIYGVLGILRYATDVKVGDMSVVGKFKEKVKVK